MATIHTLTRKHRTEAEIACAQQLAKTTARLKAEVEARKAAVRDPTLWAMPGMPDEQLQRMKETW